MSEWVAIADRLPEYEGDYLLWDGDKMCVCPFYPQAKAVPRIARFGYGSDYFYEQFATHWCELPEPPKGAE